MKMVLREVRERTKPSKRPSAGVGEAGKRGEGAEELDRGEGVFGKLKGI